jgi:hypothetical protein
VAHKSLRRNRVKCETRAICLNAPYLAWPANSAATSTPIQPMLSPSGGSGPSRRIRSNDLSTAHKCVKVSIQSGTR